MENIFVVGMTGPTGSGKSTVGKLLCERGFKIIDADKTARRVTEKGSPTLALLCNAFGDDILLETGELDRAALAKKAFADSESLEKLNSITHPAIIELIEQEIAELAQQGETKIILDAPQLFEANADRLCDFILSVLADRETRLRRIISRDNISAEQANARINAQKPDEFFVDNSDFVIHNSTDIEALTPQIDLMLEKTLEVRKMDANHENCQPFSTNPETQAQIEKSNQRPSPKKKFAILGVVAGCVVALIVGGILLLSSKGYEKVIDKSLAVYRNPSIETIEDIYPEQMWELLLERYSSIDPSIDSVDNIIEAYLLTETKEISKKMNADFGDAWSVNYDIISENKLSKDDCKAISEAIEKTTSRKSTVSKGYTINLYYTINGSKTSEGFMHFTAVKIDGDWYAAEQIPDLGWKITILEF